MAQYPLLSMSRLISPLAGKLMALLLYFLIAMSPAALEALSQITGLEVVSGTMDLQDNGNAMIEAVGKGSGIIFEITCKWETGLPAWVRYRIAGKEI